MNFTVEDCEEAFLLRDRYAMQVTIREDGIVEVHRNGKLLWHRPTFYEAKADHMVAAVVDAIYQAYYAMHKPKEKGPEGP